ncbi:MAG: 7-cyano-7-deazaguanine synthase QueC [Planctomycetota bacterium]|nr:7-cyano-7-deazaguanine synthase QueC [Planctomycetota bacterium]MEC8558477.1 7-cyano-7-deazaguanine synthase QueC [Planctomycetota bacterium]MEC8733513.1 7-cyano-7-deazaguanine synthase QueC [Planctomycetota bacterium]MEC8819243.1 7-cyano-7-deazaguanine synthase QueC [Planctomycetota bacterium]MEC9156501.1 7-cyano-7-deazaguanine synthase QueC [Planctomycetota bacterium]
MSGEPAIILLSGGLDSSTVLAEATAAGRTCHALSFRYGQRHEHELTAARRIAEHFGVAEHVVMDIDLGVFGGSALTTDLAVPKDALDEGAAIPVTYVPARNTVFLSLALAHAEVRHAREVWIGVNAIDYSGYPDCRPEYIEAFQAMANLATRDGVEGARLEVVTPLVELGKADIVRRARALGVPLEHTHSCYDPGEAGRPCEHCDACVLRARGFAGAGFGDPALDR